MIALKIIDIKDFMNKLLLGEMFDRFSFVEAAITTFNVFAIDGRLQQDFFDTDTSAALRNRSIEYSLWKDVKSYCFSIIRGKRTPLGFKIVFQLSHHQFQKLTGQNEDPSVPACNFYLNIQYKNRSLLCTTGVSYASFSLNKQPEHLWDDMICDFFSKQQIPYEKL